MIHRLEHLLRRSSERFADRSALFFQGDRISYSELDDRSDRLAAVLAEQGVKRGDRVGIHLGKSIEAVVSAFAAMKAGGVYVPIDWHSPAPRAAFIIRDCGIRHLISSSTQLQNLFGEVSPDERPSLNTAIVVDDQPWDASLLGAGTTVLPWTCIDQSAGPFRPTDASGTDLAYILYTSGSTGVPKGVMISHGAALSFVQWSHDQFGLSEDDRVSNHAPMHFDLSIFDIYATIMAGACVYPLPESTSTFPVMMTKFLLENRITVWYSVPSALILMLTRGKMASHQYPDLRLVLFAGEVFPVKFLRQLRHTTDARLFNLYGPTETNVCTYYEVTDVPEDRIEPFPIGKAIANHDVFAVNEQNRIAKTGEVGELYARGPNLMTGYWGDHEKTRRLLFPNPFEPGSDELVYRTGDLVRRGEDGEYVYVGRIDNMVKSRGYRIELGEIEAALYGHPAIKEAVVIAIPDETVTNRLKAFVVCEPGETLTEQDVRNCCRDRVPQYMVPESVEFRELLPKTGTGKIDRKALE